MPSLTFRVKYLQRVQIGPDISVWVDHAQGRACQMWIEAPKHILITREQLSALEDKRESDASEVDESRTEIPNNETRREMTINKLASEIAKREGKKSQARIGDIREILKIICTMDAEHMVIGVGHSSLGALVNEVNKLAERLYKKRKAGK